MAGFRKALSVGMTVLTLLLAALLIWQSVAVYVAGNAPENRIPSENGVLYREPVWSRAVIQRHFGWILPIIGLWLAGALASVICWIFGEPERMQLYEIARISQKKSSPADRKSLIRLILAGIILVLLILGILNGGLRDVYVKAANICTECVGLG